MYMLQGSKKKLFTSRKIFLSLLAKQDCFVSLFHSHKHCYHWKKKLLLTLVGTHLDLSVGVVHVHVHSCLPNLF